MAHPSVPVYWRCAVVIVACQLASGRLVGLASTAEAAESAAPNRPKYKNLDAFDRRACGKLDEAGERAQLPWSARISLTFNESTSGHCGATIIHRSLLLASARCFNHRQLGFPAHAEASLAADSARPQRVPVRSVCSMLNYQQQPPANCSQPAEEVVLLELAQPIEYGPRVAPVCLADPRNRNELPLNRPTSLVRSNEEEGRWAPAALKACAADQLERVEGCRERPDELCMTVDRAAEGAQTVACHNDDDLGAGLFVAFNRQHYQVGVLSRLSEPCEPDSEQAALFASLAKLRGPLELLLSSC